MATFVGDVVFTDTVAVVDVFVADSGVVIFVTNFLAIIVIVACMAVFVVLVGDNLIFINTVAVGDFFVLVSLVRVGELHVL